MDIGKIKNTFDTAGRKVNYFVDGFAAFHNFELWQVWLAIALAFVLVMLIIVFIF